MSVAHINPCKECGGERIDVKIKEIIRFENKEKKMTVWAFCRNCGHRSFSVTARFRDIEDAKDSAYIVWNNEG